MLFRRNFLRHATTNDIGIKYESCFPDSEICIPKASVDVYIVAFIVVFWVNWLYYKSTKRTIFRRFIIFCLCTHHNLSTILYNFTKQWQQFTRPTANLKSPTRKLNSNITRILLFLAHFQFLLNFWANKFILSITNVLINKHILIVFFAAIAHLPFWTRLRVNYHSVFVR